MNKIQKIALDLLIHLLQIKKIIYLIYNINISWKLFFINCVVKY